MLEWVFSPHPRVNQQNYDLLDAFLSWFWPRYARSKSLPVRHPTGHNYADWPSGLCKKIPQLIIEPGCHWIVYFTVWVRLCQFNASAQLTTLLHILHWYAFSPVWAKLCCYSLPGQMKLCCRSDTDMVFPQNVWGNATSDNQPDWKAFLQILHWYVFFQCMWSYASSGHNLSFNFGYNECVTSIDLILVMCTCDQL